MDEVHDATQFVARYYGCARSASMSSTRYEVWIGNNSKRKVTSRLKLESSKLLGGRISKYLCRKQHYKKDPRIHLPIYYDWGNDEASKSLLPVSAPKGIALAPLGVLNVVRCCSATDQLFANARSMCATAQMPCTIFCGCHGVEDCCNRSTKR